MLFGLQRYREYDDFITCDTPFSKEATLYLLLMCFVAPVLINGFCHFSIAIVLAKSMKAQHELKDRLVVLFYHILIFKLCYCMYNLNIIILLLSILLRKRNEEPVDHTRTKVHVSSSQLNDIFVHIYPHLF